MDLIKDLIDKRNGLFKKVEAIDTVLKLYGYDVDKLNSGDEKSELTNSKIFPSKVTLDKQILWIFENSINNALKLTEFQKIYNEHIGKDSINVDNKVRQLKKDGKLVLVKYDGKNILSFWGLPSWIEGDDFKSEHKPSPETLPSVTTSEVFTS